MHIFPTDQEIKQAVDLLVNRYKISPQLLGQLFGKEQRDQANSILKSLGGSRLKPEDVARLLVQRDGPSLFAGSDDKTRDLRFQLLQGIPHQTIQDLFNQYPPPNNNISSPSHMRRPLADKKWTSGKLWAKAFVQTLGFPLIFAGIEQEKKVPTILDVPPRTIPPKLADFQEELKTRMRKVLEMDGVKTRCVVTLPTGGGKTRVAVEAFIDWMQPRFANGKYLIWIAQSEELCEQAISCIEQLWSSREFVGTLRIYRYFGARSLNIDDLRINDLRGGVVVASIQQLHNRVKSSDDALKEIFKETGAMIIDEAHRAVSRMYDVVLDKVEEICGPDLFPICGLTATPGRAGLNQDQEIPKLVGRFEAHLIKPDLGEKYTRNPLQFFRDHEYLARAHHILYNSKMEYTLTDDQAEEIVREGDFPAEFLKQLANDEKRNYFIIDRLLKLPKPTPTLVYACTVDHAYFLAAILTAQGRTARAVSSNTSVTLRRALIRDFKDQKLEFLCNFGVLTTGFDAPKTECIALCRPTTSEVLYEQIIGRGLRGPKFGGTQECKIMDFADNIYRLGPPLAYIRFSDFWTDEKSE